MKVPRVNIHLSSEQLELIDKLCEIQKISRSEFFRLSSKEFLTMIFADVEKPKRKRKVS